MKIDSLEMQSLKEVIHSPWLYILTFIAAFWAFTLFSTVSSIIAASLFALLLSALTLIDFRHMILPDIITIPAIPLGLIVAPLFLNIHWIDSLLGAILGYGFFYIISAMFRSVKGYDGMGIGDIKLLSMLGAWCGAFALPLIVLGSSLFGVIFFMLRKGCEGTSTSTPMPYGPFLALSGWIAFLYGHTFWVHIFQWRESFAMFILGGITMTRLIILTIANLMLPFILRGIYIYALRLITKHRNKKGMVNITPPHYHFPVRKLLLYGVLLTILMVTALRIFNVDLDTSFEGNQARSEVINP